jgi:hypothetical protein
MHPTTTVLNKSECYFNSVTRIGNKIYGSRFLHSEVLDIQDIIVVSDRTRTAKGNSLNQVGGSIISVMLFGVIGALLNPLPKNRTEWNIDADIFLNDGRIIEIHTSERYFIEGMLSYMQVDNHTKRLIGRRRR